MLTNLGISRDAEAVYRAMLAEPSWGVADLSSYLGISERSVRKALDVLADLSLLTPSASQDLHPVNPVLGLAPLLNRAEEEIRRQQLEIEATRQAISTITAAYESRTQGLNDVTRMEGVDAVRARLVELADMARRECWSLSPGGAHEPDAMAASRDPNRLAVERGVEMRCVYQDAYRNDPDTVAYAKWLSGLGGQIRTVPSVPMKMIVVDRAVALLPISPSDPRVGAVEVTSPSVLLAICALFQQVWAAGEPLQSPSRTEADTPTPMELDVLRLLADGQTDEAVARKLGLSVRSVRRVVADVTSRLGASSRFQAGVAAARKGWI
ncbi:LuxR C-terminal-related transcriptional regulator [Micromonospora parva]|uniref:helix-turn-helix transcriptional regulator n=1 Tax=Micromonospora parva TaxID=1464048 RepID=UPI0033FBCA80